MARHGSRSYTSRSVFQHQTDFSRQSLFSWAFATGWLTVRCHNKPSYYNSNDQCRLLVLRVRHVKHIHSPGPWERYEMISNAFSKSGAHRQTLTHPACVLPTGAAYPKHHNQHEGRSRHLLRHRPSHLHWLLRDNCRPQKEQVDYRNDKANPRGTRQDNATSCR